MQTQNPLMLASIFGPFLVILGLWMLLYSDNMIKIVNSIKTSPAAFYILTVFNLFLGIVIVNHYNSWMMNGAFLVTLLGWVMTLRGVLGLFVPQILIKHTMTSVSFLKVKGLIPFIWGVALCWLAFA